MPIRRTATSNVLGIDPGCRFTSRLALTGLIDRYLPDQQGFSYQCRDTFGLADTSPSVVGTRVRLELDFIGYIYDKLLVKALMKKNWSYRKTEFVKW